MAAGSAGGLNHLEYRVAATIRLWYHQSRGCEPSSGLTRAKAFAVGSELAPSELIDASRYVFTRWFRAVVWAALFLGWGFLYDALFYSKDSPVSLAPIAVLGAGMIGAIVETWLIRTRMDLLLNASVRAGGREYTPPKYAMPKFYDFWIGMIAAILMFFAIMSA